jgi:hypothetical protein
MAVLVCACGSEPSVPRSLVDERVAQGDAQLYFHFRLSA